MCFYTLLPFDIINGFVDVIVYLFVIVLDRPVDMVGRQPEGTRLISRGDNRPDPYTYGSIKSESLQPQTSRQVIFFLHAILTLGKIFYGSQNSTAIKFIQTLILYEIS